MFCFNSLFLSFDADEFDNQFVVDSMDPVEHIDVCFLNTDEVSALNQVIESDKVVRNARTKALKYVIRIDQSCKVVISLYYTAYCDNN